MRILTLLSEDGRSPGSHRNWTASGLLRQCMLTNVATMVERAFKLERDSINPRNARASDEAHVAVREHLDASAGRVLRRDVSL